MKKILCLLLAIAMLFTTVVSVSALAEVDPENKYKYEEFVIPQIFEEHRLSEPDAQVTYVEKYEYYSDSASDDEQGVPDYVLIWVNSTILASADMCTADVCGDYILHRTSIRCPFTYMYGIYIPATNEVYELTKAYKLQIEGIDKVFTEAGVGRLMGDMDNDRRLSIKDATYIQKTIAGFEGYSFEGIFASRYDESLPSSIADYNRDREANIKDATAIQKYLAGIEEE